MRPTGRLHLGHLVGALSKWVTLQDAYDCFYFVADWHALTSDFADTSQVTEYAYDNVADWIGVGLDPGKSTFFVQSLVPAHAELYVLLSMVVPVPWLERVPTYKEQQENLKDKDLSSIGFLGYPLLQTADVAMYDARFVPVGDDQEVKRKLADALNAHLDPIRERRAGVLAKPDRLKQILFDGSSRARRVAEETMTRVRDAVKISYK